MKHSIALKIFSLAVGIVILTVLVAFVTNVEVVWLGKQVANISNKDIPLVGHAASLHQAGLYRRIAFERAYREYGEPNPDLKTINDARNEFDRMTKKVYQELEALRQGLKELPDDPEEREALAEIRELVTQILATFNVMKDLSTKNLLLRKMGEREKSRDMLELTLASQTEFRGLLNLLQTRMIDFSKLATQKAEKRKNKVLLSSSITTALAALLGLGVAWIISRNLARPILYLLQSTRKVRDGDLTIQVTGMPEDELGQLGQGFNEMIAELRRKNNLQKAIGSYIDPRIVEKVILPGRPEDLAGQKRIMTVMFTDLVGFTTLGENLTPGGLVNVLNRYFTLMSECVQQEKGIIDKFIGDALMAYWGAPFVAEEEQAAAACRAALRQSEALVRFRKELPDLMGLRKNVPDIRLRIGMATGDVIVGNIGSDTARNYTVIGDVVNLASRLDSANKMYGTQILISEDAARLAGRAMEMREIDRITVKGKTEPVAIYELLAETGKISPKAARLKNQFEVGLAAYRKQDWAAAEAIFLELAEKYEDIPSRTFLERISFLKQDSPDPDWDGVWWMASK